MQLSKKREHEARNTGRPAELGQDGPSEEVAVISLRLDGE